MSIEELFKNGYTILPSLINEETCDKLKINVTLKTTLSCKLFNFNV